MRSRQSFDQGWKFYKGDIPMFEAVKAGMLGGISDVVKRDQEDKIAFLDQEHSFETDLSKWPEVMLPHDWCVEGEITRSEDRVQDSHGYLPRGVGFYRKAFDLPASELGRKIVLEFDGVFRQASIWVNGNLLLQHRSGYTGFQVDITDVARCGAEGGNCVLVKVDATDAEGWWYEGAGIYRHVWLTSTDRLRVGQWGTYVTTPKVTSAKAGVNIRTTLINDHSEPRVGSLHTVVVDPSGKTVASRKSGFNLRPGTSLEISQDFIVKKPKLWSPDTPSLYKALTSVKVGEREVDAVSTTFGIRHILFTHDKGFFLNGKHTPIKGTCNHQDFAGVGVALPDSLHEYKIQTLKDMGSNAYRCSHHPPATELLDACDRLGMLVMDENRKLDSSPNGMEDLRSMIFRDRNHPSVILWSMENEERLEGSPMGTRILESLVKETHRLDPTRPTTAAMNHGYDDAGYSLKVDVVGFNYGHNDSNKDLAYRQRHPKHKLLGSETNSTTTTRGIYEKDEARGFVPSDGSVLESWCCDMEKAWNDVLEHPFLTGVFVWTGFDYRGEPTPYKWPCVNSHFGLMDTCGFLKETGHYHRSIWREDAVLHLMPHWNWAGKEGQPIRVWCFTNLDRVELFLNGRPLGGQTAVKARHLEWMVPYEAGELKAKGYQGKKLVLQHSVVTAGSSAQISMHPNRPTLKADGKDTFVVKVAIQDKKGHVVPTADDLVKFSLKGPGRIIGVGNGNPSSHERDKAEQRRSFNGWCMAIVQSTGKPGVIEVTGVSKGLKAGKTVVKAS